MKKHSPLLLVLLLLCGCSTLSDPQPEEIDLFKNLSIITSVSEDGRLVRKIQGAETMPESRIHLICENVCANGEKAQMIIPNVRASFKVTELPASSKEIILENQPEMLASFTDLSKMEQERILKELFETIRSKVWFDRAYHSDKKKALDSIEITQAAFAFVPATRKGQVIVPGQNRLILGLTSHSTFGEEYSYHQVFVFESLRARAHADGDQYMFHTVTLPPGQFSKLPAPCAAGSGFRPCHAAHIPENIPFRPHSARSPALRTPPRARLPMSACPHQNLP